MDQQIHNEPPQGKRNRSWTSRKMDYINEANRCLPGAPFKVAVCILNHANQRTEQAWPTQQTIATKTGLKLPTVKKAVARAVRYGPKTTPPAARPKLSRFRESAAPNRSLSPLGLLQLKVFFFFEGVMGIPEYPSGGIPEYPPV